MWVCLYQRGSYSEHLILNLLVSKSRAGGSKIPAGNNNACVGGGVGNTSYYNWNTQRGRVDGGAGGKTR